MPKILVLYYSSYGHLATMADAVAEGARGAGAEVDVFRVPETVPDEVAKASYFADHSHPVLDDPAALAGYDAIIVGAPTRFGRMASQMTAFWDRAGSLWMTGALNGKVGGAFTSTATQHGGHETTIMAAHTFLFHQGMVVVGVPYACQELMNMNEITGGSPYGAGTLAGPKGDRQPTQNELTIARYQGKHVAQIAGRLKQR